ncbi:MAG: lytic transglycosylase domain-containing protein [Bosea sp.]|jgi:soluble lytic murein transglycosylase|nr:lytic transglycosylase domain-containing protein [Bosea sp. (in: a-proteobacteria)]
MTEPRRPCPGARPPRRGLLAAASITLALGLGPVLGVPDAGEAPVSVPAPVERPAPGQPLAAAPPQIAPAADAPTPHGADVQIMGAIAASRSGAAETKRLLPLLPTPAEIERLGLAIGHYERGRIAEGDEALGVMEHEAARLAAEWAAVRSGAPAMSFGRLAAFIRSAPPWLAQPALQRRAEEAMLSQRVAPALVINFLAGRTPASPAGRAALALALKQSGRAAAAYSLARTLWREDHLGRELEAMILKSFGDALTQRDHRDRMEMYLFKGQSEPALRNAARAGSDFVKLAQARLAVASQSARSAAALANVPAALRKDPAHIFALAQHHRRKQEADVSAKLIAALPRDAGMLVDGDEWWVERRLIARQLLDRKQPAEAYAVAARHAAETPQSIIEAEWHAGWIALSFLDDPAKALPHFIEAARHAETPISVARAAFWRANTLEALGRGQEAEAQYAIAAAQPIAYYGQIARTRLGQFDVPLRSASASSPTFHPAIAVVEALEAADRHALARALILDLARTLDDADTVQHLAGIAARVGDTRLLVNIGKAAVQRGLPLDLTAYPTGGIPAFEPTGLPVERAMIYAIARQESAFDPAAVSHAGARGLMQMMPPTARETARRIGVGFEPARLTADPAYNAMLGSAHLGDLLRDWRGSYVLAFAAYNAGSGNVRNWIEAYGDPRQPGVDPIEWVERIPFTETRNYVQRVLENLQVYRARLGAHSLLMIRRDLVRGVRQAAFAGEMDIGQDGAARPAASDAAGNAGKATGQGSGQGSGQAP